MKKKNIGFILLGLAGVNLISSVVAFLIFPRIYERIEMPATQIKIVLTAILIISLVSTFVIIITGIILLIKFHNEE